MQSTPVRTIPTALLEPRAAHSWERAARKLQYPHDPNDIADFLKRCKELAIEATQGPIAALAESMIDPGGPAAVLLTGYPIGTPGPTPADGLRPAEKDPVSEVVMLGTLEMIGNIISFAQEKNGELVEQVVPISGEERSNTNSARTVFGWHTDNAFLPPWCRQDLIGLFGLVNENRAATTLIFLDDLVAGMSPMLISELQRPLVRFPASKSFSFRGWTLTSPPRPVLYPGPEGRIRVNGNIYAMEAENVEDTRIVAAFKNAVTAAPSHEIVLGPGDLLIFKDDAAMHGRVAFTGDRWVQRAYARFDLTEIRRAQGRDNRVLDVASLLLAA